MASNALLFVLLLPAIVMGAKPNDEHIGAKPGTCPSLGRQVCREQCRTDGDCRGVDKCCRTPCGGRVCSSPVLVPEEKPGFCTSPINQLVCSTECRNDNDCLGNNKCCPTTCNGRVCSDPVQVTTTTSRPASCPRARDIPNNGPCNNNCLTDRDCNQHREEKCCENRCGARKCIAVSRRH